MLLLGYTEQKCGFGLVTCHPQWNQDGKVFLSAHYPQVTVEQMDSFEKESRKREQMLNSWKGDKNEREHNATAVWIRGKLVLR